MCLGLSVIIDVTVTDTIIFRVINAISTENWRKIYPWICKNRFSRRFIKFAYILSDKSRVLRSSSYLYRMFENISQKMRENLFGEFHEFPYSFIKFISEYRVRRFIYIGSSTNFLIYLIFGSCFYFNRCSTEDKIPKFRGFFEF